MHTLKESKITVMTDLQVDSKSEKLLTNHKFLIIVKEFTSVKGPQLYYQCPNCKGKLSPIQENVKAVSCSCCSTTKKSRLSQQMYSCIVEFNHDSTEEDE